MRAAVLHECPGSLSVEDVALDSPGRHEVLVRTVATGLCHSDYHYMEGVSRMPVPVVLGHEGAGVVEAVGEDVTYVAPGDHVITFPLTFCGHCSFCLSGRPALCDQMVGYQRPAGQSPRLRLADRSSCMQFRGLATFAEEMLVHENSLVKIREEMPLDRAALIGCGVTTGLGSVLRKARIEAGATVAVIGCGGIGLNCIQGALIGGASRIVAIDNNAGKLARATEFGATDLVDSSVADPLEQVRQLMGDLGGVDYSFEAVGKKATYELSFDVLRAGGTATVVGVLAPEVKVELHGLAFLSEKRIQGSRAGSARPREDVPYFVDLYLSGRLRLDELVSARISLDQINEGYSHIGDGAVARTVITFD